MSRLLPVLLLTLSSRFFVTKNADDAYKLKFPQRLIDNSQSRNLHAKDVQ